jgi:hypothetical protein
MVTLKENGERTISDASIDKVIASIALAVFLVSLILPARSISGVDFGIACFVFSLAGLLTPGAWQRMFHLYSPDAQLIWGGILNLLFFGSCILIFLRRYCERSLKLLLSLGYSVSLFMVAYNCRDSLLVGYYFWLGSHSLMVFALFFPCSDQDREGEYYSDVQEYPVNNPDSEN